MCPRFVLLLFVLFLCGCREPSSSDSGAVASRQQGASSRTNDPTGAVSEPASTGDVETVDASETAPSETSDAGNRAPDDASTDTAANSNEATAASLHQAPEPHERVVLLMQGGPLVVDLILKIEGQPHDAALQEIVNRQLKLADLDGDGTTTWREVANHTPFRYGQFRYNPIPTMRKHDRSRDGRVDANELLRFLTRNTGITQSFVLRNSNDYRYFQATSPIQDTLDDDGDGAITQAEMDQATARLLRFDTDNNEIVELSDIRPDISRAPRLTARRRSDQPESAIHINQRTDWSYVQYSLEELYAAGGQLVAEDLALTTDLFEALDADGNGTISADECRRLAEIPPHLVLRADFGGRPQTERPNTAQLKLVSISESLQKNGASIERHIGRVILALPGAQIQFFVNEDPMLYNCVVEAVDVNGDAKVSEYELASFIDRQQPVHHALVRAWVTGHEDVFFAALDVDGDRALKARELQNSPQRLKTMDTDGDGRLQSHEIPDTMVVAFVRGHPLRDSDLLVFPPPLPTSNRSIPAWFTAMDANRDGVISDGEFLGTRDQFRHLDRDTDGFIGSREAKRARGV